jgi:cellulose synthase/poly-beta-1,6-N-acetylglucosamine synthase-like glycosyltransferase
MQALWLALFALSAAPLLWTYLLYPLLILRIGARTRGRSDAAGLSPAPGAARGDAAVPRVAVLVAAYNESAHIGARVHNLLQQDYPQDRLTVLIGSDGSADDTVAVARAAAAAAGAARVQVFDFPQNRGKASVLNELCALADADLLVFSDANTDFALDALRRLVAPFSDPHVGAVCGELRLRPQSSGGSQDHAYWTIERRLKAAESTIGGLLGANGGVYAIRRGLFRRLEPDTICDDFVIAMNVAAAGWKNLYLAGATAFEHTPQDEASEFHRRVRIGIGNYQALFRHPEYLFRAPWPLRFTYLSHKVLRWFTPLWLLGLLAASAGLRTQALFGLLFWLQAAGYVAALLIYLTRRLLPWPGLLRGGMLFVVLNAAFVVALVRYTRGDYRGSWRRTVRA